MRRLLLRFLLLAVFLNTSVGLPLHAAEHLRPAAPDPVPAWTLAQAQAEDASSSHDTQADGPCAWCLAHAQPASALAQSPSHPGEAGPAARPGAARAVAFVPGPGRWPFASRDPPPARPA